MRLCVLKTKVMTVKSTRRSDSRRNSDPRVFLRNWLLPVLRGHNGGSHTSSVDLQHPLFPIFLSYL